MIELFPQREIFIDLFGWQVRWYGVMYVAAFWVAWILLPRLQTYRGLSLTKDQWTQLLAACAAGVLIGGRLGYVLFYEPAYFLSHPAEAIAIWDGGMSSHGGFIGVVIAVFVVSLYQGEGILRLFDTLVVPAAVGLALGRIGNGINQELFPGNLWLLAVAKDLFIAGACYLALYHKKNVGIPTATFLILYSILRFLTEYIRIQEFPETFGFTRGQLLTLPIFFLGVSLLVWSQKRELEGKST